VLLKLIGSPGERDGGADGTTGITRAAKQVFLSKTTDIVSDLQGKKGLKKRFTDGKRTTAFRKWCLKRERAKNGDKRLQ
jgi:hypothetical protein